MIVTVQIISYAYKPRSAEPASVATINTAESSSHAKYSNGSQRQHSRDNEKCSNNSAVIVNNTSGTVQRISRITHGSAFLAKTISTPFQTLRGSRKIWTPHTPLVTK